MPFISAVHRFAHALLAIGAGGWNEDGSMVGLWVSMMYQSKGIKTKSGQIAQYCWYLISQMLNVWYIYLHLPPKLPKCREIGHTLSIWVLKSCASGRYVLFLIFYLPTILQGFMHRRWCGSPKNHEGTLWMKRQVKSSKVDIVISVSSFVVRRNNALLGCA